MPEIESNNQSVVESPAPQNELRYMWILIVVGVVVAAAIITLVVLSLAPRGRDSNLSVGGNSLNNTSFGQATSTESSLIPEYDIVGTDFEFTPNIIEAAPGLTIKINFTNNGTHDHGLIVEGIAGAVISEVAPGQTGSVEFRIPVAQRTEYRIICGVGNHADLGMVGTLRVL